MNTVPPPDYRGGMPGDPSRDDPRLWHVTLTMAGERHAAEVVREALTRLGTEHAFLHSLRYATDRAEVCYWDEAPEMLDAAAMAMRVWIEHRASAGLPAWEVVGLEVLEKGTFQDRDGTRTPAVGLRGSAPVPF